LYSCKFLTDTARTGAVFVSIAINISFVASWMTRNIEKEAKINVMNVAELVAHFSEGFSKYTYHAIWEKIEQGGEAYYTAENLAEMLQIARVTVRRYLVLMEKEEKIYKLVEYGKVGRPQHKYRKI